MTEYIMMASMATATVVLMLLRTNTAICFLALCSGSVLLSSSGTNAALMASSLTSGLATAPNAAKIALLLIPVLVCAALLRGQINSALLPLAALPAVCTVLLATIFVTPLLPENTANTIAATETWELLIQYQEPIVGIGLLVSVLLISMTVRKPHDKHKKGKH